MFCLLAPSYCCLSHVGISTILNMTTTSSDTDVEMNTTFRSAMRRLRHTPATSRPKYESLCMILIDCRLVGHSFGDSFLYYSVPSRLCGRSYIWARWTESTVWSVYMLYIYLFIYLFVVYIFMKSWLHSSFHMFVCHCRANLRFTPFWSNATWQFTPLLNLRSLIFNLTSFWLSVL